MGPRDGQLTVEDPGTGAPEDLPEFGLRSCRARGARAGSYHGDRLTGQDGADHPAALALHERALRLARDQAFEPGASFAQVGLGLIARRQGRLETAEAQLAEVLDAHRVAGFHPGTAFVLAELGFSAELRGDPETARARHLEGLRSAQASGDPRAIALALEELAGADALAGHHDRAGWLMGAADSARRSVDRPLPPAERIDVDRISAAARAALGDAAFDTAWRRGAVAGLDAVLATVVRLPGPTAAPM